MSIRSKTGMKMCTQIIDLVHMKLGNKAFAEIVECRMDQLDEFFWRYLKFEIQSDSDFIAELGKIHKILEELPNHPDIRVFLS